MASTILSLLHICQTAFSAYNLYLASITIQNLLKYEEKSKKAAEYSNIAENQLWRTRYTQASGTIAVLFTFLSSIYLAFSPSSVMKEFLVAGTNVVALIAAWKHVGDFWRRKSKVPLPGVGKYNDAISLTQEIRLNMSYLAASWVLTGLLSLIF